MDGRKKASLQALPQLWLRQPEYMRFSGAEGLTDGKCPEKTREKREDVKNGVKRESTDFC